MTASKHRATAQPLFKTDEVTPMKRIISIAAVAVIVSLAAECRAADEQDRNKQVIRAWIDKLNAGDWKAGAEDFAEDTRNFGRSVGRQGVRAVLEDIWTTFPDSHMEIEDMVAEGDSVVLRCKVSGTHRGKGKLPVNGGLLVAVEPTQKHYEIHHIHWFKLRDGKISDHWANRDDLRMMQQLGLIPKSKETSSRP
jgi:steroid delta-isomerase-like uncharacterized protein